MSSRIFMGVRWDTGKHTLPYPYSEGDQVVACKSIALTVVFFFIVSEAFLSFPSEHTLFPGFLTACLCSIAWCHAAVLTAPSRALIVMDDKHGMQLWFCNYNSQG